MGSVFAIAFIGIIAYFVYLVIPYRGFRGAMFGSKLRRTVGEVQGTSAGLVRSRVRVHVLDSKNTPEKHVGLEFIASSVASYQMMPISLSRSEVVNLIVYLQQAIGDQSSF